MTLYFIKEYFPTIYFNLQISGTPVENLEVVESLISNNGMQIEARNNLNKKNSKINVGPSINNENSALTNHSGEES